jgi:hypothetical protein
VLCSTNRGGPVGLSVLDERQDGDLTAVEQPRADSAVGCRAFGRFLPAAGLREGAGAVG